MYNSENALLELFNGLNDDGKRVIFNDLMYKFSQLLFVYYEQSGNLNPQADLLRDLRVIHSFYEKNTKEYTNEVISRIIDPTDDQFKSDAQIDLGLILKEFEPKVEKDGT